MKGREAFGYVVAIEGAKITLNLMDTHKGHFVSHRDGVSSVTEINGLFGVDAGTKILVLRVNSLSFVEPREVHKGISPRGLLEGEPLRQLIGTVAGWLSRNNSEITFTPDSLSCPSLGAEAFPLNSSELAAIIRPSHSSSTSIIIGSDSRSNGVVQIGVSELLGRHVAVLGSTGQGKSCFTASIIQQLLKLPNPRIVIFDINGEFSTAVNGHIANSRLKTSILGGKSPTLKIPYYALGRHGLTRLLLPSEKTQRPALAFAINNLNKVQWFSKEGGIGLSDESCPSLFDDCRTGDATNAQNTIEKLRTGNVKFATKWPHMLALACLIAESHSLKKVKDNKFERDAFHYSNVAPLITRIKRFVGDPLFTSVVEVEDNRTTNAELLDWKLEGEKFVDEIFGGKECYWKLHIVNLRNVAHDLMPMVLGSLLELFAFELFNRGQGNTYPTLLILEEAHHYLRQFSGDEEVTRQNLAYERLAKEGRKFGLGLWVSTQRPAEVSQTVLSQCGTWVVFRLASEIDLHAVGSAGEWIDRTELNRISGLPRQQALIFGSCLPVPVRVIAPTANPKPKSLDPNFSEWCNECPPSPNPLSRNK